MGFHFMYYTPHNGVGASEIQLRYQTAVNTFGRVCLLAQSFFLVCLQAFMDEVLNFRGHNTRGTEVLLPHTGHDFSLAVFLDSLPGDTQALSN